MPLITAEASKHCKNMSDGRVAFGHDGFDGRADRLMRQIELSNAIAENVAYGKFLAQEVVNRWIKSPGHRKNEKISKANLRLRVWVSCVGRMVICFLRKYLSTNSFRQSP